MLNYMNFVLCVGCFFTLGYLLGGVVVEGCGWSLWFKVGMLVVGGGAGESDLVYIVVLFW